MTVVDKRRGAVFFDRDGVLNEDIGYLFRQEDFRWIDGARDALGMVNQLGFMAIVVTNQSGVARGYYSMADVDALHDWMRQDLARDNIRIDAFYACPFHGDSIIPEFRVRNHPDRKPNPGMMNRAISDWNLDKAQSMLVGDKPSDLAAANNAGIRGALFPGGNLADFARPLFSALACDYPPWGSGSAGHGPKGVIVNGRSR